MKKHISATPSDPLSQGACTCFNLRRATRAVTQFYDAALDPAGLRSTQYTMLSLVTSAGPVAMRQLAERLGMDRTTLTRNLRPLESRGLIRIGPGEDRRARLVGITPAGRKALDRARPYWKKAQADLVARLGDAQWRVLIGNLTAVTAAVRL